MQSETYTYQVDKIRFTVTPVYKTNGESMSDILWKLMLADIVQDGRSPKFDTSNAIQYPISR